MSVLHLIVVTITVEYYILTQEYGGIVMTKKLLKSVIFQKGCIYQRIKLNCGSYFIWVKVKPLPVYEAIEGFKKIRF